MDLEAVLAGFVQKALVEAGGNKTRAARLLGLSRGQLYSRLERYDLRRRGTRANVRTATKGNRP
jgi:DNA-binding protein Fis